MLEHIVGPPGPVLVGEAERAQLLIVGTREHIGIRRLLTGSVSHYCLGHASCPVVAIRAAEEPRPSHWIGAARRHQATTPRGGSEASAQMAKR